jgi:hypothetical protein
MISSLIIFIVALPIGIIGAEILARQVPDAAFLPAAEFDNRDADGDRFHRCAGLHVTANPSHRQTLRGNPLVARIALTGSAVPTAPMALGLDTVFYTFDAPDASAANAKTATHVVTSANFELRTQA